MKVMTNSHLLANVSGGAPETGTVLTEATGIGSGIGASFIISRAGGLAGVSEALLIPTSSAAVVGVTSAALAGWQLGSAIYENSVTVQDGAIATVGFAVESTKIVGNLFMKLGQEMFTSVDQKMQKTQW